NEYSAFFASLQQPVQQHVAAQWGSAERDPFFHPSRLTCGDFAIPGFRTGNIAVLVQPARGYNLDPKATYHDPALPPPHSYLATYAWLADSFRADAVIDLGKHGTLEWLPGKALALSAECFPEAVLGPAPHLYPFIVNDPGEGTQAKRRGQAVLVDHRTPPLPRAGLHVFGESPAGERLDELLLAIARARRGRAPEDESLIRTLAADLDLGDPLALDPADPWTGPTPEALSLGPPASGQHLAGETPAVQASSWRTVGDTIERLDALALRLVSGTRHADEEWPRTRAVLGWIEQVLRPAVAACGAAEIAGILAGLDGGFVPPGPSGAPRRARPDVLPTGRNFYSVDTRAVPTAA